MNQCWMLNVDLCLSEEKMRLNEAKEAFNYKPHVLKQETVRRWIWIFLQSCIVFASILYLCADDVT